MTFPTEKQALQRRRLERAFRLTMRKPLDRRRLKRAMRLRALVWKDQRERMLRGFVEAHRQLDRAAMGLASAFEAFGESLRRMPPTVMILESPPCRQLAAKGADDGK